MFADAPGTRAYAAPRRENDAGGRFTNRPSGDSRRAFRPSACAVVSCGHAARPSVAGLAAPAVAGATPLAKGSVRVRGEVEIHTSPLPSRGRSRTIDPCGKAVSRTTSRTPDRRIQLGRIVVTQALRRHSPRPLGSRARAGLDRQAPADVPGRDPRLAIRGASRLCFASAPERVQRSRGATAHASPSTSATSPMTPPPRFSGLAGTFRSGRNSASRRAGTGSTGAQTGLLDWSIGPDRSGHHPSLARCPNEASKPLG